MNDSVVTGSDAIRHESVADLGGQILVGDGFGLLARGRRGTNVGLIFQRLERAIAELRRYDDCASTSPAGGDHDRLTLCCAVAMRSAWRLRTSARATEIMNPW